MKKLKLKWPETLPVAALNKGAYRGSDAVYKMEMLLSPEQTLDFYTFCDKATCDGVDGSFGYLGIHARALTYFYEPVKHPDSGEVYFKCTLHYTIVSY